MPARISIKILFYFFLGLFNNRLYRSLDLEPGERASERWLNSNFMRGGLIQITPSDPFEEEKGEPKSMVTSIVGTPLSTPTIETKSHTATNPGKKHEDAFLTQKFSMVFFRNQ